MDDKASNTCFVIMPFGEKEDINGKTFYFDKIYEELIKEPILAVGLQPLRCDEIEAPGSIHRDMFEHIAQDDVAIVDLTMLNPNVFYELGVRHALKSNITVLIQAEGSNIPFNIRGQRIIKYKPESENHSETRTLITKFILNGLKRREADSPVTKILDSMKVTDKGKQLNDMKSYSYQLKKDQKKQITLITGDILSRNEKIDIWVNSENTNMQMARFYDQSLSAAIRYHGAKKDENEELLEDTIAIELEAAKGKRTTVNPFTVLKTGGGALTKTHGVKKIFHVATTIGIPGSGWTSVPKIEMTIPKCLQMADTSEEVFTSIVFPMLGTGVGKLNVYEIAPKLINSAINYLSSKPDSKIENVYFMGWNGKDLEACKLALDASEEVHYQS